MMRIPRNLRINADDFGLSPSVGEAVIEAARSGLVNSTSVVSFQDDCCLEQLRAARDIAGLRFGAHLTFIEVPLLTRPRAFADGVPPRGYRDFLLAKAQRKIRLDDVRQEWRAQIELLSRRLAPLRIYHLDSHQHIHLMPGLFQVARDLQCEFGIERLRSPYEPTLRAWLKEFPMGAGLQTLALARSSQVSEEFAGVGTSMNFRAEAYRHFASEVARRPDTQFELMVHVDGDERGKREVRELRSWLDAARF
jgi:predicted glycoside hydrolase/deacetylase ChbG (UPF0249 family)